MAIYQTKTNKLNNIKKKFRIGLTLTLIFSMLSLVLVFNLLPILTITMIGIFGLMIYPLSIFFIIWGILLMLNKSISASKSLIFSTIFLVLSLFLIIHLISSANIIDGTFADYINDSFKNSITAGGVILSTLVYPIYAASHLVASYIIFGILYLIKLF